MRTQEHVDSRTKGCVDLGMSGTDKYGLRDVWDTGTCGLGDMWTRRQYGVWEVWTRGPVDLRSGLREYVDFKTCGIRDVWNWEVVNSETSVDSVVPERAWQQYGWPAMSACLLYHAMTAPELRI